MIDKLTDGIVSAIRKEFGDGYEIYIENVEQGLTEPCFLITLANATMEHQVGTMYRFENLFLVQYFPASQEARNECMNVQMRLYQALEYIEADGWKRGEEMEGEMEENVLHFQVQYNLLLQKRQAAEVMEVLKTWIAAKA